MDMGVSAKGEATTLSRYTLKFSMSEALIDVNMVVSDQGIDMDLRRESLSIYLLCLSNY